MNLKILHLVTFNIKICFEEIITIFMGGYVSLLEARELPRHWTLYSPKPQQFVRQCRLLANDNKAIAHKANTE